MHSSSDFLILTFLFLLIPPLSPNLSNQPHLIRDYPIYLHLLVVFPSLILAREHQ